jgi:hypothetical protein
MSKLIAFKDPQNYSALSVPPWGVNSASIMSSHPDSEYPYHVLSRTTAQKFLHPQDKTNPITKSRIFLITRGNFKTSFTSLDRKLLQVYFLEIEEGQTTVPKPFEEHCEMMLSGHSPTWTNNFEGEEDILIQEGLEDVIKRIKHFSSLEKGWDSYKAKKIKQETIYKAIKFLSEIIYFLKNVENIPLPFVAPVSSGGIAFEWLSCFKEISFVIPETEDAGIEYLKIRQTKNGEQEEEGVVSDIQELTDLVIDWFKGY